MSVVIKMDIPKNCEECRFCFIYGIMFVTNRAVDCYCCKLKDEDKNEPHKYEFSQDELDHRQEFCPLKSVDGLIEKIQSEIARLRDYNTKLNQASDYYSTPEIQNISGNIKGLLNAIKIIKEYCGMEDKE